MKHISPRMWIALALASFLLLFTLSHRVIRRDLELWQRQNEQRQQLQTLIQNIESEIQQLESAVTRSAPAPADMVAAYLPGVQVTIQAQPDIALPRGYRQRSVDLLFQALPWSDLRIFLEKAEAQTPPWRVTALDIRAGSLHLDGRLRLEALDKTEAVD
jgi:hypothetical protein